MSLVKAVCPICENKHHHHRIFEVNPDASLCYCPHCLNKINPLEAHQTYEKMMEKLNNVGDSLLFDYQDPPRAYEKYCNVVDIDSTFHPAYFGRLLALLCMAEAKNYRILQVCDLLIRDQEFLLSACKNQPDDFLLFALRMHYYLTQYFKKLTPKLKNNKVFYDLESLICFLTRSIEAISLLKLLQNLLANFPDSSHIPELKGVHKKINNLLNNISSQISLNTSYPLNNGEYYVYLGLNQKGKPVLKKSNYTNKTLAIQAEENNATSNHFQKIKSNIFPIQAFFVYFAVNAYILASILFLIAASLVISFVFMHLGGAHYAVIGLAAILVVLGILIIIDRKLTLHSIKKRRKSIYYHSHFLMKKAHR